MVSEVYSTAYSGIDAVEVSVQVHFAKGLPAFYIVGLPDKAVAESKERVRTAFHSLALSLTQGKITVNLAPADLAKEGSHFDLAIAIGMLIESKIIPQEEAKQYIIIGELSLDGSINAVNGTLPAAITANASGRGIICPAANYGEAKWSGNPNILAPKHLLELINFFKEKQEIVEPECVEIANTNAMRHMDLSDVKGQKQAKRALEIAAAGGHNMLMIGPPGSGKSMLAKRIVGILPPLSSDEILEISSIHSIAGMSNNAGIITQRPFREPHSSSSMPAMIGGGKNAKPGEVTLAHNGILFLDELPEFSKNVLESLRQPVESNTVTIARVNSHVTYPANFQLIAAMNPCKCGYFGEPAQMCAKVPKCALDYQDKISGPLMDRFDLQVQIPSFNPYLALQSDLVPESSEVVAKRVGQAKDIQHMRYADLRIKANHELEGELLDKYVLLCENSKVELRKAIEKLHLSMRGIHRVLKVARTIADLEGEGSVSSRHLTEALTYRIERCRS